MQGGTCKLVARLGTRPQRSGTQAPNLDDIGWYSIAFGDHATSDSIRAARAISRFHGFLLIQKLGIIYAASVPRIDPINVRLIVDR